MKTFECPKGHRIDTENPFFWEAFVASKNSWEEEKILLNSGPLCQTCFVEFMRERFATKEVTGMEHG